MFLQKRTSATGLIIGVKKFVQGLTFQTFLSRIIGKKFGLKLASRKSPGILFYVVMLGKKIYVRLLLLLLLVKSFSQRHWRSKMRGPDREMRQAERERERDERVKRRERDERE